MPIIESTDVVQGHEVTIYVEVDNIPNLTSPYEDLRDASKLVAAVRDIFGEGLELARNCAVRVVDKLQEMDRAVQPDEFEVQLAIKLDSQVGAIIAKLGTEAQLQVTMKWKKE